MLFLLTSLKSMLLDSADVLRLINDICPALRLIAQSCNVNSITIKSEISMVVEEEECLVNAIMQGLMAGLYSRFRTSLRSNLLLD